MCGIIGYTGYRPACEVLLEGLGRLEYRGYDSAGILVTQDGGFSVSKCQGRLENLRKKLKALPPLHGTCGMGHTRWATHGGPSDRNSHPHGTARVMLVHNGIIENYLPLRAALSADGYPFLSETDTEIAAAVLDRCYRGDPIAAIRETLSRIEGSYAFVIAFADHPDTLYALRKDGPLIVAPGDGENFVASDVTAVIGYTNRFFTLDEGDIAILTPSEIRVIGYDGTPREKILQTVTWSVEQAQKDGYAHFMQKEIHEQPQALLRTVRPRVKDGVPCFDCDALPHDYFSRFSRLHIVACGTAMHAGLVGKFVIEQLARLPVDVDIASEFRYRDPILAPDSLVVIISQSGETADSLAALRLAHSRGIATLAIVNVAGSSIAREADQVIFTYAGPEISVASTKAYSVQIAVLYLIAFAFSQQRGTLPDARIRSLTAQLLDVGDAVRAVITQEARIDAVARRFAPIETLFFLGRGLDHALACEGSLKLKEISYLHCEAYAAGELKHGTISLITSGVPVIALATQERLSAKMVSNIKEVKARGATVVLIAKQGETISGDVADTLLLIDAIDDLFAPFPAVAVLQLIAYFTARAKGCDIDKPRNLAKSVTVE